MKAKLKLYLVTLPRWFAAPQFIPAILIGAVLAGGLGLHAWLAATAGLFIMAGAHCLNSVLDYSWTKLDAGAEEERSAEKTYTHGQSVIAMGLCSPKEVIFNALAWYLLAMIPVGFLTVMVGWPVLLISFLAMLITFWYSIGKMNWTHELAFTVATGLIPVLFGMFAVSPDADWGVGLLAGVCLGLVTGPQIVMDEVTDAEANIDKGAKSIGYKALELKIDLPFYQMGWLLFLYIYQLFLITIGIFAPLTAITFIAFPLWMASLVFSSRKSSFEKGVIGFLLIAGLYNSLLLAGQIIGG